LSKRNLQISKNLFRYGKDKKLISISSKVLEKYLDKDKREIFKGLPVQINLDLGYHLVV